MNPRCVVVNPDGYSEIAIADTYAGAVAFAKRRASRWALGATAADITKVVPAAHCRRAVVLATDANPTTALAVARAWPTFSVLLVREDYPQSSTPQKD